MRVLFVIKNINRANENPYVRVLFDSLKAKGVEVDYGLDKFWNAYQHYDLIHFQWPEKIFGGGNPVDIPRIQQHLALIKNHGIKLVITCHNLKPHKSNPDMEKLYNLLYGQCDAIHHMGSFSFDLFKKQYPLAYHFIIEHHTYYDFDNYKSTQAQARKILKIPENAQIILCFGEFRFASERRMVMEAFQKLSLPRKFLLAPGFYRKDMLGWLMHSIKRNVYRGTSNKLLGKKFLPNDCLPLYLIASDILLIQRMEILNSGNLALGLNFGKSVVGPMKGNVGRWLVQLDNPVFNPCNTDSIVEAMLKAFERKDQLSASNLAYARQHLSKEAVAAQMLNVYHTILKN